MKQESSELFDAPTGEESKSTSNSEGNPAEGSTTHKSEENQGNALSADENKQKQIEVYQKRVDDGEIAQEDIPHAWIRKEIKSLRSREDVQALARAEAETFINEREAEKTYQDARADLQSAKLTAGQKQELESEYKDLVAIGYDKGKALIKAMKIAQIPSKTIRDLRSKREAMNLSATGRQDIDTPDRMDMSDDEIVEEALKNI